MLIHHSIAHCLVVGVSLASLLIAHDAQSAPGPNIYAKAYVVLDNQTGRILRSKNANLRLPMASTTKIMTALMVIEALDAGIVQPSDLVSVNTKNTGRSDARIFGTGQHVSVQTLLDALMIKSSNEAALSLGIHLARIWRGDHSLHPPQKNDHGYFAKWMTKRAKLLNLKNTHFVNAHGRDPEDVTRHRKRKTRRCTGNQFKKKACQHFSTAHDLARLTRYALKNPRFRALVSQRSFTVKRGKKVSRYENTNQLLGETIRGWSVYGVKTGTTNRAGHCLVSAAKKGQRDVTIVVLRSTIQGQKKNGDYYWDSDTRDVRVGGATLSNGQRFNDTKKLLKSI